MTLEFEQFNEDSQPCMCGCGCWFELNDGNPCGGCKIIFCTECLEQPFDLCPNCKQYGED